MVVESKTFFIFTPIRREMGKWSNLTKIIFFSWNFRKHQLYIYIVVDGFCEVMVSSVVFSCRSAMSVVRVLLGDWDQFNWRGAMNASVTSKKIWICYVYRIPGISWHDRKNITWQFYVFGTLFYQLIWAEGVSTRKIRLEKRKVDGIPIYSRIITS